MVFPWLFQWFSHGFVVFRGAVSRRPPRRPRRPGAGVPTPRRPAGRADGAGRADPEPR